MSDKYNEAEVVEATEVETTNDTNTEVESIPNESSDIIDENGEIVNINDEPNIYKEKVDLTFKNYLENKNKEDIEDEDIDDFACIQINRLMDKTEGPLECLKIFHVTNKDDMHDIVDNNYVIDGRRSMIDYDEKIFRLELILTVPAPIEEITGLNNEDDNTAETVDTGDVSEGDLKEESVENDVVSEPNTFDGVNDTVMKQYSDSKAVDDCVEGSPVDESDE